VLHYDCSGVVIEVAKHFKRLERRSRRSGPLEFAGFSGIADYVFDKLDDASTWLMSVGSITGAGPKSAFGCGFLDVQL
jgi:CRISPR/Cas system endoribonuclease Cas6 (RAMP superfamily)